MEPITELSRLDRLAMPYSEFAPQLYNYCRSLGFQRDRMMPSRAFCSDESQGYPIILLAQHFGVFPFDHGLVGGRVATDRHGPHAHHGEDLVILQASHVGYDAATKRFGVYQRQRTAAREFGDNCGKLCAVLHWYQQEYRHACEHIWCGSVDGRPVIFLDNQFLDETRREGLFLHLDQLVDRDKGPLKVLSTSKMFNAAASFVERLAGESLPEIPDCIGDRLSADLFVFRRGSIEGPEGLDMLERALAPAMPELVTSPHPALDAAQYHTQVEFDRTYRSIRREPAYRDKNLLFIAGINIDILPIATLPFPVTKFVPWAAYVRFAGGRSFHIEQQELADTLRRQSANNPDRMSFDASIEATTEVGAVSIEGR